VWLIAGEIVPERPALRVAATAVAAFLPMRLSVSSSASNDALAEATTSLALLLLLRGIRGSWDLRRAAALGGALGAALLTKQSGVLLLPVALAGIALAVHASRTPEAPPAAPRVSRRVPDERDRLRADQAAAALFLRSGAVALGIAAALAGWWFVRNQVLYGDPLAQGAFNEYFADTPRWESFRDRGMPYPVYLGMVARTTFATFWGAFGHLAPDRPELFLGYVPGGRRSYPPQSWAYPVLAALTLAAAAGWLRGGLRRRGRPRARMMAGLLALHSVFVVAAFFNFNATYFQAQGRYLFPAIAALALALGGGWLEWARKRENAAGWTVTGAMVALAGYALFGVVVPGFRGA